MRWVATNLILATIFMNGCLLIPEGRKTISGHRYSKEATSFLDIPGTTREETIASLGLPSWESGESKVLLYTWESSQEWLFVPAENNLDIHQSEADVKEQHWALLIAYDERGIVRAHAVRRLGKGSTEEVCAKSFRAELERR